MDIRRFRHSHRIVWALLAGLLLAACDSVSSPPPQPLPTLAANEVVDLQIVMGQLVFVPAYSEVISVSSPRLNLSTTLAIHNTDPNRSIIIKSVRYYDTDGDLVREFVERPAELGPMATTGFVIGEEERRGGWGANFLVEWISEEPVYEPVIEAVMVSTRGTEGISFISQGRVISEQQP